MLTDYGTLLQSAHNSVLHSGFNRCTLKRKKNLNHLNILLLIYLRMILWRIKRRQKISI